MISLLGSSQTQSVNQNPTWFDRNPKKTIFIVILFLLATVFMVAEIFLRITKTTDFDNPYEFNEIAKDIMARKVKFSKIRLWYTDNEGVFKANPHYDWDESIKINQDGFRSIEFKNYESKMKKILFLGDSYTWGENANPITKCFVDLIAKEGYLVFNTGIPGTALNQYAYLAEKYVPLLKPDVVMTMICMANDINGKPPPMVPHKDLFHTVKIKNTSLLLLSFDDQGNYLTPEESIQHSIKFYEQGHPVKKLFRWIFTRTLVGTRIWMGLWDLRHNKLSFLTHPVYAETSEAKIAKNQYVIECLQRIHTVCEKYHAQSLYFLLQVKPSATSITTSIPHNLIIFQGFNPLFPTNLTDSDYVPGGAGAHLNNQGHEKYAQFVLKALKERGY